MKVKNVMVEEIEKTSTGDTLEQAAAKMQARNIGFLPVMDGERIVGVITDRDMVLRAISAGLRPHMTTVREAMTPAAYHCYEDHTVSEASLIMEKHHVRRLLVLSRDEKLVGIVSLTDLAVKTHNESLSGRLLGKIAVAA